MSKTQKPKRGWFSKKTMADVFAVAANSFDRSIRPHAPADAVKQIDGQLYFRARAVIDAWSAAQAEKAKPVATDPMLVGDADSPALERFRAARADQEEMKRDQMAGMHASLTDLDTALARFAGHLRRAGETLQRRFGNEASDILNEGLAEAEKVWHTERQRTARTKQTQ